MRLKPYAEVNGTPFTATRSDVVRRYGRPLSEVRNEIGLTALDYGNVVFRFQDSGRLEEVTAHAPVLHLDTLAVPFESLKDFVLSQDPAAYQRMKFWVSPRFGLAFVADEPDWVTALAEHCLPEWEAL